MRAVLPLPGADDCPVCGAVHGSLDEFWACPRHGHRLQSHGRDGDMEVFRCPAFRCGYTRSAPPKPRTPSKGDPMTTIQTRPSTAIDAMWASSKRLNAMLSPLGIEVNLFIASAASALYNNADLMKCAEVNPASLIIALTECAGLGHLPGTKDYYLTPRGLKGAKSGPEVRGIEGYEGVVKRYYNSGEVRKVVVREVCANDYFRYEGEDEHPIHRFSSAPGTTGADFFGPQGRVDRGPMVGVYCAVQGNDGHWYEPAILSRDDVHAARDSGGYQAADPHNPWNRYDAGRDQPGFQGRSMWRKTAAKRNEPWVPTSTEDKRQRRHAAAQAAAASIPRGGPAPGPALSRDSESVRQVITRPGRPALENGAVTLHEAIGAHFGRLGLDDIEEREAYVCKLAGVNAPEDATEDDLRSVLAKLESCETVADLQAAS